MVVAIRGRGWDKPALAEEGFDRSGHLHDFGFLYTGIN